MDAGQVGARRYQGLALAALGAGVARLIGRSYDPGERIPRPASFRIYGAPEEATD
jgi:hypothetical protein